MFYLRIRMTLITHPLDLRYMTRPRIATDAVKPYTGFTPPASLPVRKRCIRIVRPLSAYRQGTSLYVWYGSSSECASCGKGASVLKNDFNGCEKREATSDWFKIGWMTMSIFLDLLYYYYKLTLSETSRISTTTLVFVRTAITRRLVDATHGVTIVS